jgi:hypothetical protein
MFCSARFLKRAYTTRLRSPGASSATEITAGKPPARKAVLQRTIVVILSEAKNLSSLRRTPMQTPALPQTVIL